MPMPSGLPAPLARLLAAACAADGGHQGHLQPTLAWACCRCGTTWGGPR